MSRHAKGHMRAAKSTVPFRKRLERTLTEAPFSAHFIYYYNTKDCIRAFVVERVTPFITCRHHVSDINTACNKHSGRLA